MDLINFSKSTVPLTWSYTKEDDGSFGQIDLDPPPFNKTVLGEPPLPPRKIRDRARIRQRGHYPGSSTEFSLYVLRLISIVFTALAIVWAALYVHGSNEPSSRSMTLQKEMRQGCVSAVVTLVILGYHATLESIVMTKIRK